MSVSKKTSAILREEEEESSRLGACSRDYVDSETDCSICRKTFVVTINEKGEGSNKCPECLKKIDSIPSGFPFKFAGEPAKEFECAICLSIIQDATEIPSCNHVMCAQCLVYYEQEQRKSQHEMIPYMCSVCQRPYNPEKKIPVKSMDRYIQNSLKMKCLKPQCEWIGCIQDYKIHNEKCQFEIIPCPYFKMGCLSTIEKKNIGTHNQLMRVEHELLIFNIVNNLIEKQNENHSKIEEQNEKMLELQKRIDTRNATVDNRIKKIDNIEKKNLEFQNTIDTQNAAFEIHNEKVREFELKIKIFENEGKKMKKENEQNMRISNEKFDEIDKLMLNESSKTNLTKKILENQLQDFEKQIETLNQFAEDIGKLNLALSDPMIRLNIPIVNQKEYDEAEEVELWNNFTKEISTRNDVPDYVANLKKAVASYSTTVYPKNHGDRIMVAFYLLPSDNFINNYLKLECPYQVNFVSIKSFDFINIFEKELEKKRFFRNSHHVGSFWDTKNDTLNVVVFHQSKKVTLYHSTDDNKNLKIYCNGTRVNVMQEPDDDDGFHSFGDFIFYFHE